MSSEETPEDRRRRFRVVPGGAGRSADEPPNPAPLPALPPGPEEAADPPGPDRPGLREMSDQSRSLAPGAPPSPGTAPLEIARHLRMGEALVWWDAKTGVDPRPLLWLGGASAVVLVGATLFAPEFWAQPLSDLWPPLAALFSPMLLWLLRERMSLRSIMVTDTAILEVPRRGEPQRLQFTAIQQVRRDVWTGGIVLIGKHSRVRIPAALVEAARAAVWSQRRDVLRGPQRPDDAVGFMG